MKMWTRAGMRLLAIRMAVAVVSIAMVSATASSWLAAKPNSPTYDVVNTASIGQSASTIGLADSQLYFLNDADLNRQLDEMASLGVQNVRIQMPWAGIEPAPGQYDWSTIDRVVNAANARNMGVLGVLNATPAWAATPNTPPFAGAPTSNAAYASFASAVASRYAGKVSAYEVWNEPNIAQFWAPKPDPAAYTALLKAAYTAIKAADPNATVVGGVVTSTLDFGDVAANPVRFINEMYANGAAGYFDALSFHPYQFSTKFSDGLALPQSPLNQLTEIRALMVQNGDAGKLIWATEYGLPTSVVSEQQQADYIRDILSSWKNVSYGGPIFIYTTRDIATGSTNPEDNFGVFRTDWTAKLAAEVIKQAIAANVPPPPVNPGGNIGAALAAYFQQAVQAFVASFNQNVVNTFASAIANAISTAIANYFAGLAGPQVVASAITSAAVPEDANEFAASARRAEVSTSPDEPQEGAVDGLSATPGGPSDVPGVVKSEAVVDQGATPAAPGGAVSGAAAVTGAAGAGVTPAAADSHATGADIVTGTTPTEPAAGTPDKTPAAGTPDKTPAAGTPDNTPAAGTPDKTPAAGTPDKTPAAGTPDKTPAGTPDKTPAAGKTNAGSPTPGSGSVSQRVEGTRPSRHLTTPRPHRQSAPGGTADGTTGSASAKADGASAGADGDQAAASGPPTT